MRRPFFICLIISFSSLLFQGCDSLIFDDLSECPQGIDLVLYMQTNCSDNRLYPSNINECKLFIFDKNEILVESHNIHNVTLSKDYFYRMEFYRNGKYKFVVWAGEDLSVYNFSAFESGETSFKEMFISIKRQNDILDCKQVKRLYYASLETNIDSINREEDGSVFFKLDFNLIELTNYLKLTIFGLPNVNNYEITITDDNGKYNFGGLFENDSRFNYSTEIKKTEEGIIYADFLLMKLSRNRDTRLTITNTYTQKIIYSVNLVEGLILYSEDNTVSPPYNLDCDNIFNIVIYFEPHSSDGSTFMIIKATVNEWVVIKRPIILYINQNNSSKVIPEVYHSQWKILKKPNTIV